MSDEPLPRSRIFRYQMELRRKATIREFRIVAADRKSNDTHCNSEALE